MIQQSLILINELQHENGLFSASKKDVSTGYNKAWIRDNIYTALGLEKSAMKKAVSTYQRLLDIMLKHEHKIDWMIKQPFPKERWRYIHARYHPGTMEEIWEEWGNKQNDAVGALLFKIGDLESKGINVLRDENDFRIIKKLVDYLNAIEYWQDADNGMWEENEEVHASSVGACVAGLKKINRIVDVDSKLIKLGEKALNKILPRESETKNVDLALLSLIYPYNVVDENQKIQILENIEKYLLRKKGVVRYAGDQYYFRNAEAEWTMGLPWLAIIYKQMNMQDKYEYYMSLTMNAVNEKGELPELYFADSEEHNENSPLGWSQSLFLVAMEE
ncbi:MAG TPA: glycoside hydrolase family 15 protein [Candidatus Nanoarchaeia archaeon]|nr:glycoside hydrolase family 15 protein [Candidatus Nanoarchaeia archaeon]